MYVWRMKPSFWPLRLYLFAWDADPHRVNFCKFFWGLLFSPLALLVIGLARGGRALRWAWHRTPESIRRLVLAFANVLAVLCLIAMVLTVLAMLWLVLSANWLMVMLIIFGFALGVAGIVVLMLLADRYGDQFRAAMLHLFTRVLDPLLRLLFRPFAAAFHLRPIEAVSEVSVRSIKGTPSVVAALYHALKDRTCPTIEVAWA